MAGQEKRDGSRYQLRHAAGSYWILDMWQEGLYYRKPLLVNEVGACIWEMMEQQKTDEEIVAALCRKYKASEEEVQEDVAQFRDILHKCGISI